MAIKTSLTFHLITILLRVTSLHYHCLESRTKVKESTTINWFINKEPNDDYSDDYSDNSYYNTITKTEAFVDKSLFIEDILKSPHNVLFTTCPPGFGKTVNLDTLKIFLKLEAYDNGTAIPPNSTIQYQFFKNAKLPTKDKILQLHKNLLISKNDDLIETKVARYPVVHIDFEGFEADSRENYFTSFKKVIAKSFHEHKYMLTTLQQQINDNPDTLLETDLKKYKNYLNANISDHEVEDSIRFLCGILHINFKSDIVILVDEMDLPIRKLIFSPNSSTFKDEAIQLHGNILRGALKNNPFLYKGLLTGVLPMTFRDGFFLLNDFVRYEFPDNDYVDKYYGFSETEVESLFDRCEIQTELRREAKTYYFGYEHKSHPQKIYFPPVSIMKFLREKQCKPYFIQPTSLQIFDGFKKSGIFVEMFATLMIRKSHKEYLCLLPPQDPVKIFEIVENYRNLDSSDTPRGIHKSVVTDFLELMITYMLAHGYISWCHRDGNTVLRIPNDDVYSVMQHRLYRYFEEIAENDPDAWRSRLTAQRAWNDFLVSSDVSLATIKNLQIILKQFFNTQPEPVTSLSPLFFPDIVTYRDAKYLELAIITLMKPNGTTFLGTDIFNKFKYPGLTTEKKFAPDVVLLHDKCNRTRTSAIIEFKSKRELVKALEQAEWYDLAYKSRMEFAGVTQLKYIACWATDNKEVNLISAVIPTDWILFGMIFQFASNTFTMITVSFHMISIHHHCLHFEIERDEATTINWFNNIQQNRNDSTEHKYTNDIYFNMITSTEVFIDKSLFLKDILKDKFKVSFISRPSGFGKSVNLDMLRCFLKMEVYKNGTIISRNTTRQYKFFKHGELFVNGKMFRLNKTLLISKYDRFIENALGRSPVIFIDFKGFEAKSRQLFFENFKKSIATSFHQHKYMLKILKNGTDKKPQLKQFKRYLNEKASAKDLHNSILFLCTILHDHFKRRVFVLVDQTDLPIDKLVFSLNTGSFKNDAIDVYVKTLQRGLKDNPSLYRGLMTGRSPIAFAEDFDNIEYYQFLNDDYTSKYYGFSDTQVELLFDHYKIERDLRYRAKQYYKEYEHKNQSRCKTFSPLSIMKFLEKRQCKPYSIEPISFRILDRFKNSGIFVEMFTNLMIRKPHHIGNMFGLSPSPVQLFQTVRNYENLDVPSQYEFGLEVIAFYGIMNQYMLDNGYLSWCPSSQNPRDAVEIPNEEVYADMKHQLYNYFQEITVTDPQSNKARLQAQNIWNEFLISADVDQTIIENVQIILNQFTNTQPKTVMSLARFEFPNIITYGHEKYTQLEISSLTNPNGSTCLDIELIFNEERLVPDIIVLYEKTNRMQKSAIIEFKSERIECNDALDRVKKYLAACKLQEEFRDVTQLKYISCWIKKEKEISLTAVVTLFNWYERNLFYLVSSKYFCTEFQNMKRTLSE